jgi:hypothetical protein
VPKWRIQSPAIGCWFLRTSAPSAEDRCGTRAGEERPEIENSHAARRELLGLRRIGTTHLHRSRLLVHGSEIAGSSCFIRHDEFTSLSAWGCPQSIPGP